MNKIHSIGMYLLLVLLTLVACTDDYMVKVSPGPDEKATVTLSPSEKISFPATKSNIDISVLTNMDPSTISVMSKDTSWCKVSSSGKSVSVQASENMKYVARSTYIKVKVFSETQTIEVEQSAKKFVSDPIYPITKTYKIQIPAVEKFQSTKVYKVMDGEQKIAEICLEYLKNEVINSRAVVVYPGLGSIGDYKNGFIAYLVNDDGSISAKPENGGNVIFDYVNNTLDYLTGTSNAVSTVYLSTYGITKEEQQDAVSATPEPYTVRDVSGNTYPVVKIGTEVWLGSNLRTTKLGDGTAISLISSSDMATYGNTVPFATYPMDDPTVDPSEYGYLYNSAVVMGNNEALIGSAIIDGNWRLATGGASSSGINGITTDWQRLFKYVGNNGLGALLSTDYSWSNGGNGQFDINTLSNKTGLSIVPAGEFYDVSNYIFAIGANSQAFFFYGGGSGYGYNLAEVDGKVADQAGVRQWPHNADACSIRLVRIDTHK